MYLVYVFEFQGLFLALVAQPDTVQIALWLVWFAVLGFLKVNEECIYLVIMSVMSIFSEGKLTYQLCQYINDSHVYHMMYNVF